MEAVQMDFDSGRRKSRFQSTGFNTPGRESSIAKHIFATTVDVKIRETKHRLLMRFRQA
jgi:hypothetical protein